MSLYKKLGMFVLLMVVSFLNTGCSSSENKCDSSVNNELIKVIFLKNILSENTQRQSKETKKLDKSPLYATMMNDKEPMDGWSMLSVMSHKDKEENHLKDEMHTIKIHSYVRLNRDDKLDKIQCGAIVESKTSSTTQSFDIVYTSEPSQDENKMLLKITSLKKKN